MRPCGVAWPPPAAVPQADPVTAHRSRSPNGCGRSEALLAGCRTGRPAEVPLGRSRCIRCKGTTCARDRRKLARRRCRDEAEAIADGYRSEALEQLESVADDVTSAVAFEVVYRRSRSASTARMVAAADSCSTAWRPTAAAPSTLAGTSSTSTASVGVTDSRLHARV